MSSLFQVVRIGILSLLNATFEKDNSMKTQDSSLKSLPVPSLLLLLSVPGTQDNQGAGSAPAYKILYLTRLVAFNFVP